MDEMLDEAEGGDLEVTDNEKGCESPVFRCINSTKSVRGNNFDSSDYDIPSYQINQSVKSRRGSSKYGSEANETILPFSPVFTPVPTASTQFQPPSIHSLGTVVKALDKSSKNNAKSFPCKVSTKPCSLFESLGMNDKDISWVSSMASPPPKQLPGSELNTIEKATFLPEEKFQNIQPRALFSPNLDEDFDCHPISFCSEGEDDEAYKSNMRLSDVCATLRQLKVKSLDQVSEQSAEDTVQEIVLSPVLKIKRKKSESVMRRKKGTLVVSPDSEQHYEFLVGKKDLSCEKAKSEGGSNAIEDDSFQTMSFSSIDELCKTLVTEKSNSSSTSRLVESKKPIVNTSTTTSNTNTPKTLYGSKTTTNLYELCSIDDLQSYAKALEEESTGISVGSKTDKPFEGKGSVRFDVQNKDPVKMERVERLSSEVAEERNTTSEENVKKSEDESTGWEKMKEYLSESQLNVSDGEIFRTVENLEKTLASQESNDFQKQTRLQEAGGSHSQNSGASVTSKDNAETRKEEAEKGSGGDSGQRLGDGVPLVGFRNVFGLEISVSREALEKGRKILRECFEEKVDEGGHGGSSELKEGVDVGGGAVSGEEVSVLQCKVKGGFLSVSEKEVLLDGSEGSKERVGEDESGDVEETKVFMVEGDESWEKKVGKEGRGLGGFSGVSGERRSLWRKAGEAAAGEKAEKSEVSWMMGFMTSSGKAVGVSAKALEKAKALMRECDENVGEGREGGVEGSSLKGEGLGNGKTVSSGCEESAKEEEVKGFLSGSGKVVSVSAKALERGKAVMSCCEQNERSSLSEGTSTARKGVGKGLRSCGRRGTSDAEAFGSKSEKLVGAGEGQGGAVFGFLTALGNKIKISGEAIEKAKSFWCNSEESEKIEFPAEEGKALVGADSAATESSTTEKSKAVEWEAGPLSPQVAKKDGNKAEDSGKANGVADGVRSLPMGVSGGSKEEERREVCGGKSPDDCDEIIPEWLHVYTTSPSVASERTELSPLVAHEDGKCLRSGREYIVRSPVLGSGDRFHGRRKRRKARLEEEGGGEGGRNLGGKGGGGFVVPYKEAGKRGGAKRTSELALDFSVPFKRVKVVEVERGECDVRGGRARRREEQEKAIREKQSVRPREGSHLRRKCSEKQRSWGEAVGGSLPEVHSEETLKGFGVVEDVLGVTVGNAAAFAFKGEHFFGPNCGKNIEGIVAGDGCVVVLDEEGRAGVGECKRAFLASGGVQPSLVPEGWVENHYKWIVWKLAHYERSFPQYFAGRCLTPGNVLLQLKYRYDREIDRNERSALRKILERDDTSAKRMVLCVCGIKKTGAPDASSYELSVTDGWYSCPARPDAAMARILDEGKLKVGTKLLTQGAVLVNNEQGASPLEISGDVYLRISTNSTRRVKWDTKLGFQKNPQNFVVSLTSILPRGGPISRIDVILVRVYPTLYMEKTSDGHHVTRNRRSEEKADAEYRRIQEQRMEAICNEVRMEMGKSSKFERKSMVGGLGSEYGREDGLSQDVEGSSDPSGFQNESDRFRRELSERIEKRLEKERLCKRNVSEFFRAKVVDMRKPDYNSPAVLSVWQPNEDVTAMLSEGKLVSLFNVTISNSSRACKPLQINTTRQTQYFPIPRSVKYPARKLTQLKDVSSKVCPAFGEVDLVGVVVFVENKSYGTRVSQVVYLTDFQMNFVGIVFWESCKAYGWENVLKISSVVACINLQWKKTYVPQDVPSLYVNENSIFTENPKHSHLKEEMENLRQNKPPEFSTFVSKCEEELVSRLEHTKVRANCSTNFSAEESTLGDANSSKPHANGFESKPTASSTPIKPFNPRIALDGPEPSPIQKRIEKLQAYGEPPPLPPLIITNNAKRKFAKSNLRTPH